MINNTHWPDLETGKDMSISLQAGQTCPPLQKKSGREYSTKNNFAALRNYYKKQREPKDKGTNSFLQR